MENTSTNEVLKSLESGYLEGAYDKVIEQLVKTKESYSLGEFHYNLGTVLLKKGDLAAGRYNLELAKSNGYASPKIDNNLNYVKQKLGINDFSTSPRLKDQVLDSLLTTPFSLITTVLLSVILVSALCYRVRLIKIKSLALIPILFSLVILFSSYLVKNSYNPVITLKETPVHEGPSAIYDKMGDIPGGAKIILSDESKDWVYVMFPDNYAGWIKKEKLGYIK